METVPPAVGGSPVGAWRSPVAHLLWEQGVGGSNPLAPTNFQQVHGVVLTRSRTWPIIPVRALERGRTMLDAPVAQLDRAPDF